RAAIKDRDVKRDMDRHE
ncbi:MAG: hypothetical protein KDC02_13455, partial [Flavobacteriales bacterium]|nr:hypothetical protein [Flavobacteriales bacterium]